MPPPKMLLAVALSAATTSAVVAVNTSSTWTLTTSTTAKDVAVEFTVALQPGNLHQLDQMVARVSDPYGASYGQYISSQEVRALTATDDAVVARVLQSIRPAICENRGDSLRCTASPADLEHIFSVNFDTYVHSQRDDVVAIVSSAPLVIPADIADDVVFVSGLTELPWQPTLLRPTVRPVSSGEKSHTVVPDTIRRQYNVSTPHITTPVAQAVAEFAGADFEKQSDLTQFAVETGFGNLTIDRYLGVPNDPHADPTEATLDIQYLASTSVINHNWVWNSKDWMFTLASDLVAAEEADRPTVVSVSYSWNEAQQCHGLPGAANCTGTDNAGYINRTNVEFQKAALLGVTVLVASGDSGAHGRTDESCILNPKMHPDFPATSPFVTTVGGTQFSGTVNESANVEPICKTLSCASTGYEVVASADFRDGPEHSKISSGGGFSEYTPTPDFQMDAVQAYLNNGTGVPAKHLFNPSGRGYPDIAALSHNYYIKINGNDGAVDGTSAATPVVAGLVGLINAYRASANRPALGFFNPLLYKVFETHPEAFNDITQGSNRCTEQGCLCQSGFGAAPGWDAATGLGSPNFGRLLDAIQQIDEKREKMFGR